LLATIPVRGGANHSVPTRIREENGPGDGDAGQAGVGRNWVSYRRHKARLDPRRWLGARRAAACRDPRACRSGGAAAGSSVAARAPTLTPRAPSARSSACRANLRRANARSRPRGWAAARPELLVHSA
jgi:hypothetical protein